MSLCRWPFLLSGAFSSRVSTAQDSHSNWGTFTVAKCEVTFFRNARYERKPCVCALCSAAVTSRGLAAVLPLEATAARGGGGVGGWHHTGSRVFVIFPTAAGNSGLPFDRWWEEGVGGPTSFPASWARLPVEKWFYVTALCPLLPLTWSPSPLPVLVSHTGPAQTDTSNSLWRPSSSGYASSGKHQDVWGALLCVHFLAYHTHESQLWNTLVVSFSSIF